jgi:8-oxo-dGTP diphosphatase
MSVDCVIFGFDNKNLNVLLVERALYNKEDQSLIFTDYTLTGNHVQVNEDPDEAAVRVLNDLIGMNDIFLEQFHIFGGVDRLSGIRDKQWIKSLGLNIADQVFTVGYYSLVDCTSVKISDHMSRKVKWFPVNNLPELGYDHGAILKKALERLQIKLNQEPICFELLAEKFTLSEVQRLYEAILNTSLDTRNFRKKLSQLKYIVPLHEKQKEVRHKPAQLFAFKNEIYEKTRKEKYI